ncbi:MAG: hypothetical protein M3O31_12365 [Acidobacteriota bacterium]|nr:hypothetical protein [Acidobacteriota bacterium]
MRQSFLLCSCCVLLFAVTVTAQKPAAKRAAEAIGDAAPATQLPVTRRTMTSS